MRNVNRWTMLAVLLLTLLAFGLRVWQIDSVPPGGRDDELSNALAVSQKVLDGDWQLFYADASGHEGMYHWLQAGSVLVFGRTFSGIRAVSVLFGTLTVPLTFVAGALLFNRKVGLLAAAVITVSFWSLMYSRTGIRHVSTLVFLLPTFICFWRGIRGERSGRGWFVAAGVFMGFGFYTYFAARGVPLIVGVFCVYLLLVAPQRFKQRWQDLVLMFVVAGALAVPLLITLNNQPEAVYRVEEVAKPLTAATEGDFSLIVDHVWRTLGMFHATGDDEFLYNIPFRPIFSPLLAIVFWSGVLLTIVYAWQTAWDRVRQMRNRSQDVRRAPTPYLAAAFLLMWWLAGISPAFISIPAGSLGHTIIAQPATAILLALPAGYWLDRWLTTRTQTRTRLALVSGIGVVLVMGVALRDLPDYFVAWPAQGNTRFLYRAEIDAVVDMVVQRPELTDFAVTGLLAGPWDDLAFEVGLNSRSAETTPQPRWVDPQRALLLALAGEPALIFYGYPDVGMLFGDRIQPLDESAGAYRVGRVAFLASAGPELGCFANGLCLVEAVYSAENGALDLTWRVDTPLTLPHNPIIAFPPPPNVYDGPRLAVYTHLRDADGAILTGDDGLWVDPYSLQPGDRFIQRHQLPPNDAARSIAVGLYDPADGVRITTRQGADAIRITP